MTISTEESRPIEARPIEGRCVWTGAELEAEGSWCRTWPAGAIAEIEAARGHAAATGKPLTELTAADFPLPGLRGFFDGILEELEDGRGAVRVTGFPVERFDDAAVLTIFWGIGQHLGTPVNQTAFGEILGEVRDESHDDGRVTQQLSEHRAGGDRVLASRARARSTGPLRFHTDRCDVIALFCAANGIEGGVSKLASIGHIHNAILARRPDLHALLCRDYWRSRPEDEEGIRTDKVFALPVFGVRGGKITSQYSRTYVEQAQEAPGVPRLTATQNEALDLLAEVAEESCLLSPFAPGDLQLLNNHTVYHGRTAYADDRASGQVRCLLRLWLSVANSRALPDGFEVLWGSTAPGVVRGGVFAG